MRFTELLRLSLNNLWRRKSRTVLTVLGVMIGAAAIVVMMSIGIGLNKSFFESMESSGTLTLITVYDYGSSSSDSSGVKIDSESVASFGAIEHVQCASPVYNFNVLAKTGSYQSNLNIIAVSYDMLRALKLPVLQGQLPAEGEDIKFIAGRQCGYNFYNPNNNGDYYYYDTQDSAAPVDMYTTPLFVVYDMNAYYNAQSGEGEMPKKYLVETAAVVGSEGDGYSEFDYNVYADLDAVERTFGKMFKNTAWPNQSTDKNGKPIKPMTYQQAYVYVDDINEVTAVQQQITDMGYQCYSQVEYLNAMKQQSRTIQYVLGGIGSVSLLVAAIGITNTMLMSIYERTKEIGIFKVLGCSMKNIRSMFLYEAGMIGLGGGVLGLALSYALSAVINIIAAQKISVIPVWLAALGIGFSVAIGMISGITPAVRAMKLSPLAAIRTL